MTRRSLFPDLGRVRVPFGLRAFFRGVFLLLTLATLALALSVLGEEKTLGQRNYVEGLRKSAAQAASRLRYPTGQLALLNPQATGRAPTPLRPVLLPFSAIDFDDKGKVQQAVEMAGCLVQYAGGQTMCVAVGSNPAVGGFLYVAGSFASGELVPHRFGDLDFTTSHRVRITVHAPDHDFGWIAPFESLGDASPVRGRLTGYVDGEPVVPGIKPVRDFRGWLWQDGRCVDSTSIDAGCLKRSFLSVRLPVEVWRDSIWRNPTPRWPPPDLDRMQVRVEVFGPGDGPAMFDSDSTDATPPFSLEDLATLLLPGERLVVRQLPRDGEPREIIRLSGRPGTAAPTSPWIDALIRRLPAEEANEPLESTELLDTPVGRYDLTLSGDLRSVNRTLATVATRLSWFVAAMLLAILLSWLAIELRIIRRITMLTRRAATVSIDMRANDALALDAARHDFADFKGHDELGVLAGGLQDLLARVSGDVRRERIRAETEKDQWHAIGHEIMSPLQSLLALHPREDDASRRYVERMQQAVRVLYGSASPSEAFQSTTLDVESLDLDAFLREVANNAPLEGIADVVYQSLDEPLRASADAYALEDVITHVLRNADRHRTPDTPIVLSLSSMADGARLVIHNAGAPIDDGIAGSIFEYGVSDQPDSGAHGHRGQGLFVAKTYMAKMGGTIEARNDGDGVSFVLGFARA